MGAVCQSQLPLPEPLSQWEGRAHCCSGGRAVQWCLANPLYCQRSINPRSMWDKRPEPVAATFKFSLLNSAGEKSFVVDVAEKKMFGHAGGNSKSLGAPKFVSRDDLLSSSWGLLT